MERKTRHKERTKEGLNEEHSRENASEDQENFEDEESLEDEENSDYEEIDENEILTRFYELNGWF